MRVIGTIEARMGSSRLPGKTLMEIQPGHTLLEIVVERFRMCKHVDDVCVATTVNPADDAIARWCEVHGVPFYRGSEEDVLDRVVRTASAARADAVVQMGADSLYLDFNLVDELVEYFLDGEFHYVCNDLELTYPLGIYGHVVNMSSLAELNNKNSLAQSDREDVVRYIFEHPGEYRILNVQAPAELNYPRLRLTIDYPEDFSLAEEILECFQCYTFTTPEILDLYRRNPGIFKKVRELIQQSAAFLNKSHRYQTLTGQLPGSRSRENERITVKGAEDVNRR